MAPRKANSAASTPATAAAPAPADSTPAAPAVAVAVPAPAFNDLASPSVYLSVSRANNSFRQLVNGEFLPALNNLKAFKKYNDSLKPKDEAAKSKKIGQAKADVKLEKVELSKETKEFLKPLLAEDTRVRNEKNERAKAKAAKNSTTFTPIAEPSKNVEYYLSLVNQRTYRNNKPFIKAFVGFAEYVVRDTLRSAITTAHANSEHQVKISHVNADTVLNFTRSLPAFASRNSFVDDAARHSVQHNFIRNICKSYSTEAYHLTFRGEFIAFCDQLYSEVLGMFARQSVVLANYNGKHMLDVKTSNALVALMMGASDNSKSSAVSDYVTAYQSAVAPIRPAKAPAAPADGSAPAAKAPRTKKAPAAAPADGSAPAAADGAAPAAKAPRAKKAPAAAAASDAAPATPTPAAPAADASTSAAAPSVKAPKAKKAPAAAAPTPATPAATETAVAAPAVNLATLPATAAGKGKGKK